MHRSRKWLGVVLFVVAAVGSGGHLFAQEKGTEKGAEKPAAKAAKETPAASKGSDLKAAKKSRRLPRYYGKLGLSETQREKIYGVQEKHGVEIEKLEKQLAELREKREAECRKVLTADQKKQLTETVEAARSKSTSKDDSEEMEG